VNQAPVTDPTPLISCTGGCCGARALAQAYRRIAGCDGFLQLQGFWWRSSWRGNSPHTTTYQAKCQRLAPTSIASIADPNRLTMFPSKPRDNMHAASTMAAAWLARAPTVGRPWHSVTALFGLTDGQNLNNVYVIHCLFTTI
jgi:hypothetical protein